MKTKLQMIIRILTRKKVVLLTEECKGIYQMIFSGCNVTEANLIKNLKYYDANSESKSIEQMLTRLPYIDINPDDLVEQLSDDGEYAPLLCRCGNKWQLYWSDGERYFLPIPEEDTPTEAIQKAYDYCVKRGWIKQ